MFKSVARSAKNNVSRKQVSAAKGERMSTNRLSAVLMCALLASTVPLAFPNIAIDDYKAVTKITVVDGANLEAKSREQLLSNLRALMNNEVLLNRVVQELKLTPSTFNLASEPSFWRLVAELSGLSTPDKSIEFGRVISELRKRILLDLDGTSSNTFTLTTTSPSEGVARGLNDRLAAILAEEAQTLSISGGDNSLSEARKALEAVEAELTGFQLRHGDQKLADMAGLSQRFEAAQTRASNLSRELSEIRVALESIKNLKGRAALEFPLPDVAGVSGLRDLQTRYSEARQLVDTLSVQFGPKHPKMIAAQSDLSALTNQVSQTVKAAVSALSADEKTMQQRVETAQADLLKLEKQMSELGDAPEELTRLENRLEAAQQNYFKLAEIEQRTPVVRTVATRLEAGETSIGPIYNWNKLLSYSFISALVAGAFAFGFSGRRRSKSTAAEPIVADAQRVEPQVATVVPPATTNAAPRLKEPLKPQYAQDNDAPFDVKVKELLMRNAIRVPHGEELPLPPLVNRAAKGELVLTEGEKRELMEIKNQLKTLRNVLAEVDHQKSRRA